MNELAPGGARLDIAELKIVTTKFRRAIERCDRRRLSITFRYFPKGSCGDAALLLRAFLLERGLGTFRYALGWLDRDDGRHSHAWLEAGGIVVDITADQFPEIDEEVIVTENSPWHAAIRLDEDEQETDYRRYDPNTVADLDASYDAILVEFDHL